DGAELWAELLRCPAPAADALRVRYDGATTGDLFRALRTLEALSRARGRPRICLFVRDVSVRPVIELFKIPNLAVYAQGRRRRDYDYDLDGAALAAPAVTGG